MIGVGILGIGFMGSAHFQAMQKVHGARVVAIATRDRSKWTGDWSAIRGNYGTAAGQVDLSAVSTYDDLSELISDPDVDLIDICVPTANHRDAAIRALEAGKDVLVEKPIALTSAEASDMRAAASANGKRLLVAHVLHFMEPYRILRQTLERPGLQALGVSMSRHVSTPWREPAWQAKLNSSGGPLVDLLVHDADLIRSVYGLPRRVTAHGHVHGNHAVYYHALLDYGSEGPAVSITGGITGLPGQRLQQEYTLHASDLSLRFNPAISPCPIETRTGESPEEMATPTNDPIVDELQYVTDTLIGTQNGYLLDAAGASDSLAICLAAAESIATGKSVAMAKTTQLVKEQI